MILTKQMIKNQIKPYLGDRPLSALTTQELQKFYNTVKKKGRVKPDKLHGTELADSMVRGIHMMLHEALDMAVRLRLIVKNPTVGTTIPKNNYPPKQILNDEQLDRFMKRIRQDELWYDFFYTELTTGLRRGELCGLKWEDFDAENGKLKVRRSVAKRKGGGLNIGETKTETGTRTIVLPPSTAELLRKRKETAVSEWIFPNIYEPRKTDAPRLCLPPIKNTVKTGGASADSVPRSAPHLRHSRAGGRRGCENPVGNPLAYQRQLYAGHLHPCDHRYAEKRFRYRGELYG